MRRLRGTLHMVDNHLTRHYVTKTLAEHSRELAGVPRRLDSMDPMFVAALRRGEAASGYVSGAEEDSDFAPYSYSTHCPLTLRHRGWISGITRLPLSRVPVE